ncbi:hypothetical protein WJX74_004646 [Apatococcus lobatus]|uniref:DNA replication licensing factor MCM7 n=1 Tax=Apatococcus lobatus TaxID=904363 RepID=A0AAW1R480_9CHLO
MLVEYGKDRELLQSFLQNFTEDDGKAKYMEVLQEIANREQTVLAIDLEDLQQEGQTDLVEKITTNALRYVRLIGEAADRLMPAATRTDLPEDVFDVLQRQRERALEIRQQEAEQAGQAPDVDQQQNLPPELTRRYQVTLIPCSQDDSKQRHMRMRAVSALHVGHLVTIKGIVTHVTDVKPLIKVATYLDEDSGVEVYQEVTGREFQPLEPSKLPEQLAQQHAGRKPRLALQARGSKFQRFQEVRIQELSCEVPQGTTPRSVSVQLRGDLTRRVKPGDAITLTGVFLPEPFTGYRAIKAGLITSTFIEAMHITHDKQSYTATSLTKEQIAEAHEIRAGPAPYERLAASLAPEIFGHEDVKKALLLLMVGGVTRQLPDGMRLRGDIHVCLMGDPGVAKSQLIKHVAHISPRAVYTTGKGSSGVGLTAAVTRDPNTSEMVLEGGALVLADKGICCIDEFDKMEDSDRTAIHEVMEQQTVSIAKAGITTTLNTRTTLLAAANPAWGRYDRRRSPAENINLPPALLSRFDLMWLILDKVEAESDRNLADHVMRVHAEGVVPNTLGTHELLTPDQIRAYIGYVKTLDPYIPESLTGFIASNYAAKRAMDKTAEHSYTTARTLLSILRLAQALARLAFREVVDQGDVIEALRLMECSKLSLHEEGDERQTQDTMSAIYSKIRDALLRSPSGLSWTDIRQHTSSFEVGQVRDTLETYDRLQVWSLDRADPSEPCINPLGQTEVQGPQDQPQQMMVGA